MTATNGGGDIELNSVVVSATQEVGMTELAYTARRPEDGMGNAVVWSDGKARGHLGRSRVRKTKYVTAV